MQTIWQKRVRELKYIKGVSGTNFRTTFDSEVQTFAGEVMKDRSGSACVLDIYTGDVIAMVSTPTFDANKFVHGISTKEWEELINNKRKPLINKSISGLYPPGSTIKPLVALAALEYGIIDTKFKVNCKGHDHPYELYQL